MTLKQYISNPMGGSVMSYTANTYEKLYKDKFNKLMVRENGKMSYKTYRAGKGIYYIHLKVPSETVNQFYYDVVFEFTPPEKMAIVKSLLDYDVKFYSNDPAFVFTFAHAFIEHKLFISSLKDKMSIEAIKQSPKEKNPNNIIGYVKTFYFAYLMMEKRGLFTPLKYIEKYNSKIMKADIEDANTKINDRIKRSEIIKKQGADEREKRREIDKKYSGHKHDRELKKAVNKAVRQTKTVDKIKVTKKTNAVKSTKVTKRK